MSSKRNGESEKKLKQKLVEDMKRIMEQGDFVEFVETPPVDFDPPV